MVPHDDSFLGDQRSISEYKEGLESYCVKD